MRDRLVRYVAAELGDPGGVLIADETGFLKTGAARPACSGSTPGRRGRSRTARSGYSWPTRSRPPGRGCWWTGSCTSRGRGRSDRGPVRPAGIREDVTFATKPELARAMIGRVRIWGCRSPGSPPTRPTATTASCASGWKRARSRTWSRWPATRCPGRGRKTIRADRLAAQVPGRGWQRLLRRAGSQGRPLYDWALISLDPRGQPGWRWLLIRRSLTTGELAFYRCYAPGHVPARHPGQSRRNAVDHRREACAPRGALLYSRLSREELGGRFLGLMAYLAPKG